MLGNFFMLFMLTLNLYFKKQIHAITSKKVINSEYINILIYVKKNLTMMIKKNAIKIEIPVILPGNIEALHIISLTRDIKY